MGEKNGQLSVSRSVEEKHCRRPNGRALASDASTDTRSGTLSRRLVEVRLRSNGSFSRASTLHAPRCNGTAFVDRPLPALATQLVFLVTFARKAVSLARRGASANASASLGRD